MNYIDDKMRIIGMSKIVVILLTIFYAVAIALGALFCFYIYLILMKEPNSHLIVVEVFHKEFYVILIFSLVGGFLMALDEPLEKR